MMIYGYPTNENDNFKNKKYLFSQKITSFRIDGLFALRNNHEDEFYPYIPSIGEDPVCGQASTA